MRRWIIPVFLAFGGCEGGDDHVDEGGASSAGGGTSGGTPGGTSPGGGGTPVSSGAPPDSWDGDMPLTTTYHAPVVGSGQVYWRRVFQKTLAP